MAPAKKQRKQRAPRRARKGGKKPRGGRDVRDFASLSVKRSLAVPGGNPTVNNMYYYMNVQLADFARAVQVAQAYQHFKISKCTMTIKPTFDTFTGGGSSKMNLYYMVDKSGSIPTNVTLEGLKQMGAKAHALDEKPFVISWRPSVLTTDMTAGGAAGAIQSNQYKLSPWLSTGNIPVNGAWAPNLTDHLGLYWFVEQLITGVTTQYQVEFEVQFQFKKPLYLPDSQGTTQAIAAFPAIEDGSKDGIVGGID